MVVRRADMIIVDAAADMETFPHAECTDIEPSFRDLIGLSVARGYSIRGAGALRAGARLQPPRVPGPGHRARRRSRGSPRRRAWRVENGDGEHPLREGGFGFLANTCHIWAEGGPGAAED